MPGKRNPPIGFEGATVGVGATGGGAITSIFGGYSTLSITTTCAFGYSTTTAGFFIPPAANPGKANPPIPGRANPPIFEGALEDVVL